MSDVLLSFGAQNITGDATKMLNDLQAAFSKADEVKVNVGLKVDNKALNVFKGQLTKILNGLTLSDGAPVKLRIDGVGDIESSFEAAKNKIDDTTKSAEKLKKSLGKMSLTDTKSALKKTANDYVKMQEVLGRYSHLNTDKSKGAFNLYANQAKNVKQLHDELKQGVVTQDEYVDRLARITLNASKAQRALSEYDAAAKKAKKALEKPKLGELSDGEINSHYKSLTKIIADKKQKLSKFSSAKLEHGDNSSYEKYLKVIEKYENLQKSLTRKPVSRERLAVDLTALADEAKTLERILSVFGSVKDPTAILKQGTNEYAKALSNVSKELEKTKNELEEWTAAKHGASADDYKILEDGASSYADLYKEVLEGNMTFGEFNNRMESIGTNVEGARQRIKGLSKDTKSVSDRFKEMVGKFSSWFGVSQAVMLAVASVKRMVATVIELDSAMTELKKVTDETDATYERFLNNAGTRAKNIGASLTDVVTATADFARLGYDLEEASQLADTAIVYKNVADGIKDISDASSSIISTVKAFGLEAKDAMSIVDKFNEVNLLAS